MTIYFKGFVIWCLIAIVEVVHGILRTKFLSPKVGDFRSRQIAVLTGSLLIGLIAYFKFHWMGFENSNQAYLIGAQWFFLMVCFEMILGHYVFHFPWKWLLSDFNLFKGRLLPLGMLFLFLSPWLCGKLLNLW
jgi:hypothetical protein